MTEERLSQMIKLIVQTEEKNENPISLTATKLICKLAYPGFTPRNFKYR